MAKHEKKEYETWQQEIRDANPNDKIEFDTEKETWKQVGRDKIIVPAFTTAWTKKKKVKTKSGRSKTIHEKNVGNYNHGTGSGIVFTIIFIVLFGFVINFFLQIPEEKTVIEEVKYETVEIPIDFSN